MNRVLAEYAVMQIVWVVQWTHSLNSNLSVASTLLGRIAAKQLIAYLDKSDLMPRLQSAYMTGHSSETAMLTVLSDILLWIDAGDLSAQVLLDNA